MALDQRNIERASSVTDAMLDRLGPQLAPDDYARGQVLRACIAAARGDTSSAVNLATEAAELCRKINDREGLATALANLALFEIRRGRFSEAKSALLESLPVIEEHGRPHDIARAYEHLSGLYYKTGDTGKALEFMRRAKPLIDQTADEERKALLQDAIDELERHEASTRATQ